MSGKVVCVCCKKEFEPFWEDNLTQAMHCASEIKDNYLTGHYGSTVADMDLYEFVGGRSQDIPEGTVCDDCIVKFKNEGVIKIKAGSVW